MPIRRSDHGCHGYSTSRNWVLWAFSSLVVQHDQAPRLNRIQATSTRGVRARIRRVAGCAPPTGFAGHAGATANLKLTFHLDHSAGADHRRLWDANNPHTLQGSDEERKWLNRAILNHRPKVRMVRLAIVQCAVSVEASSSTGAS